MIFVTGGTGMLGSYLLLELTKSDEQIIASKRANSSLKTVEEIFKTYSSNYNTLLEKIKWIDIDLFDQNEIEEQLNEVAEIYHCAAQISASPKQKEIIINNNLQITKNLINAAINKNVSKFCHVSSIAALGNTANEKEISETTLWKEQKNNSSYSTSKYLSEMEVWRGIAEGLNAIIINPSVILGIGDWEKGSANLFKKVSAGFKYYTNGASGFVYAKDVALIMLRLMENENFFKQAYIISAENLTFRNIFNQIANALEVNPPNTYATPLLTQIAWRLEWIRSQFSGKDPLITKESARTAHKILKYNNKKLLDVMPYRYRSIEDCIQHIANTYKIQNAKV